MFSKKNLLMAITMVVSLALQTACERFLRAPDKDTSHPEGSDTVVVNENELACLKKLPEHLEIFLSDQASDDILQRNLDQAIGCVQTALASFMKNTRGAKSDSYTGPELQHFFNRFLFKENNVTDAFRLEIMKLKVVAVGGSTDVATRMELEKFSQFLNTVKNEGHRLQGQLRLLFFRQDPKTVSLEQIEGARQKLQEASRQLLSQLKITESHYEWVDLVSFLHQLNGFLKQPEGLKEIFKWLPLIESAKILFIGENAKFVSTSEWSYSVSWAVDLYSSALKFFYKIRPESLDTPQQWAVMVPLLDETLRSVENSPALREHKVLDAKAIDQLLEKGDRLQLFTTTLKVELLKSTYRKALVHLFDGLPGGQGDAANVPGLTDKHLRVLRQEFNVWKLSQIFLNEMYLRIPEMKLKILVLGSKALNINEALRDITNDSVEKDELTRAWFDFAKLLQSDFPIVYGKGNKLYMGPSILEQPYPFSGALLMNGVRSFVRLMFRGYGEHRSAVLFENRLSSEGLVQLEEDFQEFALRVGFLDPRAFVEPKPENPGKRTFKEANFFTFHGNGDEWMTSTEAFEEMNMMLSGGRFQTDQIMEDLAAEGCLARDSDVFNKPTGDERCFARVLRLHFSTYFANLPKMGAYVASLTEAQYASFYQSLWSLAALDAPYHKAGRVEYAEIRMMATVLSYVEALFLVYDKDQNQKLNERELVGASPRFASFIASVSPVGHFLVEDIFLFLVYKGYKPDLGDSLSLGAFKLQRATCSSCLGEVDRLSIINTMGILKKESQ